MRFSTRGRYGTRAMYVLAENYGRGPIPLRQIADNQLLSEAYLEQLVSEMRKAGLVKSVRGAQGGYMLARSPEEITVGDIVRVLEGPIAPTECSASATGEDVCDLAKNCVSRWVWEKLRDNMEKVLNGITLADMLEEDLQSDDVPRAETSRG